MDECPHSLPESWTEGVVLISAGLEKSGPKVLQDWQSFTI